MLQVYKKVEKILDNPYGVIPIHSLDELGKPFLICLSAQDNHNKSLFGIMKEGARAARVNTTDEIAAGFKINDFPIAFLGLKFVKDNHSQNNYEEIVDSLLYPFLIGNEKRNVEDIKRKARKINFMTYCDGTLTYERIEKRLKERLQSDGYIDADIKDILSQISLVAIGTMVDTSKLEATTATFIDVNDAEIYTDKSDSYKKLLQEKKRRSIFETIKNIKNILYIFEGSGNHSLKEYFLDDNMVKPVISSVLAIFLQNSIDNKNTNSLISISFSEILKQLNKYGDETKEPSFLLKELDNALSYGGAPKYTLEEAKIRHELDLSYSEICLQRKKLERLNVEKKSFDNKMNLIIEGIRKFSSETAFYQILVSAGLWQAPFEEDIFQEKSDKDIRKLYEELSYDKQNTESENRFKL